MNQDEIGVLFRSQEEQRRVARWKRLENELKLSMEKLDPVEQAHHKEAIRRFRESRLRLEKELSPGYWQRLWRAICGR